MIRGIVFDLDNTLYDYDICNAAALDVLGSHMCSLLHISHTEFEQSYRLANAKVKEKLGNVAARHNRLLYMQSFLEQYHIFRADEALYCYDLYWNVFLDHMRLNDMAKELILDCRGLGLKVGICTDLTAHIQFRKLIKLGIHPLIDAVVTSEENGIEKPDLKMFQAILIKLKLEAHEAIMVGDDFEKDILGASKAGMRAVWYNRRGLACKNSCEYKQIKSFSEKFL